MSDNTDFLTTKDVDTVLNYENLVDKRRDYARQMNEIVAEARDKENFSEAQEKKFNAAQDKWRYYDSALKAQDAAVANVKNKVDIKQQTPQQKSLNQSIKDFFAFGKIEGEHIKMGGTICGHNNPNSITLAIPSSTTSGTGSNTSGASTIPTETWDRVLQVLKYYASVRRTSYNIRTASGNPLNVPTQDSTSQEGAQHTENADTILSTTGHGAIGGSAAVPAESAGVPVASAAGGPTPLSAFSHVQVGAYTFHSRAMSISRELIQDSQVDATGLVIGSGLRRVARTENKLMTTGSGTNTLEGFRGTAQTGATSANKTGFTIDNLVDTIHKVDPAYRMGTEAALATDNPFIAEQGIFAWQVHDGFVAALRKLKDSNGLPVWLPSVEGYSAADGNRPATIYGYPYEINQFLDAFGTANGIPAVIAHWGYYLIRDVGEVEIMRYDDSVFASQNAVGFQVWARVDARWIHPKTSGKVACAAALQLSA